MPIEEVKVVGLSNNKKSGGKPNLKIILAIIGIVVLTLGIVAGIILVREQQNISEEAQVVTCVSECPSVDGVLRNCNPPAEDGTPQETVCSSAGLIAFCGTRNYCCPSAEAAWSSNLTLCATAAPTIIATPTVTATSTAIGTSTPIGSGSPTATATSISLGSVTPTASASGTVFPVPETGMSWPTIMGAGVGIIVVLTSLFLVF